MDDEVFAVVFLINDAGRPVRLDIYGGLVSPFTGENLAGIPYA
jgi:hypothetical protein